MKSYKVEVKADSSGTWASNALRWPHDAGGLMAATIWGGSLFCRWTAVREWRVTECDDEPGDPITGMPEKAGAM